MAYTKAAVTGSSTLPMDWKHEFFPSQMDPFVYYKDNCLLLGYVNDCIIFSEDKSVIDGFIYSLKHGKEKYILTDGDK